MKLLWVFSTFAIGGAQRRAALIMEGLGPEQEHVVIALDDRWTAEQFVPPSVRWRKHPIAFRKTSLVSLSNIRLIRKTLAQAAPDLLLTSNWGSIEWAIANRGRGRTPHIHFEDGFGADESPVRQNPRRALARRLCLRGRPLVVPSETLREVAVERWKLPASDVCLIPNGIDVERYAAPARRSAGITVGSIGGLRREKNYPRLVRAVAEAAQHSGAPLRLALYGEGDQRAAIEAESAACSFEGLALPGATVAPEKALAEFDIFALSSDTEQMPISLMEAMASGLAVVATDVGDIAGMVSAENGPFIAPLGDDRALAEAIAALARDPDLRRRLGEANRAKARERFSLDKMVAAQRTLFEKTVARR
ncbi:MAG: glycosyltransferase family 4 protein [Parvularculaceae bacterium]